MAELSLAALCPRISIYETEDVIKLLQEQCGLPDLSTLFKPWQRAGVERVQIRSSTFETILAPSFPLCFDAAADVFEETSYEREGGWLDSVANQINARLEGWLAGMSEDSTKPPTPWYDLFLAELLDMRPMHPQDTFSHPIACVLAVSAAHPEPLNALAALYASTAPTELFKDRPYADPTVLRYYVVVHDVKNGDLQESTALLEQIKRAYGVHCALLPINSLDPSAPPPLEGEKDERPPYFDDMWTPFLKTRAIGRSISTSAEGGTDSLLKPNLTLAPGTGLGHRDVLAIRVFLREFVVQSLLPFMERDIQQWNEQLSASRRGLTNRFFNAGRKYFGSRPASPATGGPPGFIASKNYYPYQAHEAQTRKLADFAFMTRDYRLAISTYDLVRKDNQNDKAWRDYAAATRLMGLAQLLLTMQSGVAARGKVEADAYLEQAYTASITGPNASAQIDELKVTCLMDAALRSIGEHKVAALGLARCAGDVEEISSALLLEQASAAHLGALLPGKRKSALYLCLAALRYEKCGVKILSQRCLQQAEAVYGGEAHGWRFIRDHIQHSLGRQCYKNGVCVAAAIHFLRLLSTESAQDEDDEGCQQIYLNDFEQAYKQLGDQAAQVAEAQHLRFPQVFFRPGTCKVEVARDRQDQNEITTTADQWTQMESHMLQDFRQSDAALANSSLERVNGALAGLNEAVSVHCLARNPLATSVVLTQLQLDVVGTDGSFYQVKATPSGDLHLNAREAKSVLFVWTAQAEGQYHIVGVTYLLDGQLKCRDDLSKRGKRLQTTREQRIEPTYATDESLDILVRKGIPRIAIEILDMPRTLLSGELRSVRLRLTNSGETAARHVRVATSQPAMLFLARDERGARSSTHMFTLSEAHADDTAGNDSTLMLPNDLRQSFSTSVSQEMLRPSESKLVDMLLYEERIGHHPIALLAAFASAEDGDAQMYTTRTALSVNIEPALELSAIVRPRISGTSPYRVEVSARNVSTGTDISIDNVITVSPHWRCAILEGVEPAASSLAPGEDLAVACGADLHLDSGKRDFDYTSRQLQRLLSGQQIPHIRPEPVASQVSHVFGKEGALTPRALQALLASKRRARGQQLAQSFASIADGMHARMFELFAPRSLDILVEFSTKDYMSSDATHGIAILAELRLGSPETTPVMAQILDQAEAVAGGLYAESQQERSLIIADFRRSEYTGEAAPVLVGYEGPQVIEMDLESDRRSTRTSVSLRIQNISLQRKLDFLLDLHPLSSGDAEGEEETRAIFIGTLVHRGTLAPGQVISIDCGIWLPSVGVYDVSRWHLQVTETATASVWDVRGSKRLLFVRNATHTRAT